MSETRRRAAIWGAALALLTMIALAAWQWQWDMSALESWIEDHVILGAAVYVAAVASSVVLVPLSSLALIPLAAHVYGVLMAALLSGAGWWIGCLIAFQIARWGRRLVERVTSLEAVDRLEHKIPEDVGFAGIVVLRMVLPVDIVSFALGFLRDLRFSTYAVASLIGIIPFAFLWSFAGGELSKGHFLSFALAGLAMVLTVLVIRRLWQGLAR